MTRLFVLTGGPCSGKSTCIDELARRGRAVIREAARAVILEGKLHPARAPVEFQREVLRRQLAGELAERGVAFADRGVGDHFGYIARFREARGIAMPGDFLRELEAAWEAARARYPAVFLLEPSPLFASASYRDETAAEAKAVHDAIAAAYRSRHPRVIDLPWLPVGDRVDRILAVAEGPAYDRGCHCEPTCPDLP